jgi:hypothetical protein
MVVHHVIVMMMIVSHIVNLPVIEERRGSELVLSGPHLEVMSSDALPTLEDDEAKLAEYGTVLADQIEAFVGAWFVRLVEDRCPGLTSDVTVMAGLDDGAGETIAAMRALLATDIAHQRSGPLEILRWSIRFPTQALTTAGVAPVERDEFARRNFPNDVYDLTPASFAAADPSLHEPGLMWGAAKAHVHLRRRRESTDR